MAPNKKTQEPKSSSRPMVRDTRTTRQLVDAIYRAARFYFRMDEADNVEPPQPGFSGEPQPNTSPNRSTNDCPVNRGCVNGRHRPVIFICLCFIKSQNSTFSLMVIRLFFCASFFSNLPLIVFIYFLCIRSPATLPTHRRICVQTTSRFSSLSRQRLAIWPPMPPNWPIPPDWRRHWWLFQLSGSNKGGHRRDQNQDSRSPGHHKELITFN